MGAALGNGTGMGSGEMILRSRTDQVRTGRIVRIGWLPLLRVTDARILAAPEG